MSTPAAHAHAAHAHGGTAHGGNAPHVVPISVLLGVFAALMVLTGITVGVTHVDLGAMNVWIALAVAAVKAGLVALYFMHLRWDHKFFAATLLICLAFLALFIAFAMTDAHHYQPNLERPPAANLP
ncbi:MAG TPA: cytochrome C oxidase subunit IV family protein [Humisphaera sp.]